MLARRCVCRTDGTFGFAIARTIGLVISFRVWYGVDATESMLLGRTVTCSHITAAAEARCGRKSPGKTSGDLSRDGGRLKWLNGPVLCTSPLPF